MSISDKLTRLQNAKTDIADAITENGGTVEDTDGLEEYPERITSRFGEVNNVLSILLKGPILISKTITENGEYLAEDDNADGYSSVLVNVESYTIADAGKVVNSTGTGLVSQTAYGTVTTNGTIDTTLNNSVTINVPTYSSADNGKVVKNGALSSQTAATSSTITSNGTYNYDTTYNNSKQVTVNVSTNYLTLNTASCKPSSTKYRNKYWAIKTWNIGFNPKYIWTDGTNIYYSNDTAQYVLNKTTSTWRTKTWDGLMYFTGDDIWTDGNNIYHSSGSDQHVLNKSTSTWSRITWSGLTSFSGRCIWTDGNNIYYSLNGSNYVLNKSTSTWSTKTWSGLTNFDGGYVWTDGSTIFYSAGSTQYKLNGSTWSASSIPTISSIYGDNIWTDGENIYHSSNIYDKDNENFYTRQWNISLSGSNIWTDGTNIYTNIGNTHYVLTESITTSAITHSPSLKT
jgi:hypothetical protein